MKKVFLQLAVVSTVVAMNSCSYTLFTTSQCEELKSQVGRLQLYIDRPIEIEKVVTQKTSEMTKGRLTTRKGVNFYTIDFADKLGGIALDASDGTKVSVQFDEGRNDFLIFRNFGDDDYYYLSGRNNSNGFFVNYSGHSDFQVLRGQSARLLMRRSDKVKVKKDRSRAKGMYVK